METRKIFNLRNCFAVVIMCIVVLLLCASVADGASYSYKTVNTNSEDTAFAYGKYYSVRYTNGSARIYISDSASGKGKRIFTAAEYNEILPGVITNGKTMYCLTRNYETQKESIYKVDIEKKTKKRLKTFAENTILYDLKGYSGGKLILYGYSDHWKGDMDVLSDGRPIQRFSMMIYNLKNGQLKKVGRGYILPIPMLIKGNYVYGTAIEDENGVKEFTFSYNVKTEKETKISAKKMANFLAVDDGKLYYCIDQKLYRTNLSGSGTKTKMITLPESSFINVLKDGKLFYIIRYDENWTYDEPQYMVYDLKTGTRTRVEADEYAKLSGAKEEEMM